MEEAKVLETALKSCKQLERYLRESINAVRRLNIRYNLDWLIKNYKNYVKDITTQNDNNLNNNNVQSCLRTRHIKSKTLSQFPKTTLKKKSVLLSLSSLSTNLPQQPSTSQIPSSQSSSCSSIATCPAETSSSLLSLESIKLITLLRMQSHKSTPVLDSYARRANDLYSGNRKINYKFIKIKRGMETLLMQMQQLIDISNRQHNYVHLYYANGRDGRFRVCCH